MSNAASDPAIGLSTFSQRTLMRFRREPRRRRKCSTRSRWHWGIVKVKRIWYNLGMSDELVYEEESYALRGAVFEVYKTLGNSYLEEVYQNALA